MGQKKLIRPKLKREIPKDAKKVLSGVIFDVYQWQQKMFDGSYSTFEMLKRPDTVDILAVTKDKKILLLEQEQPGRDKFLCIPAGRVDKDETPLEAAKRELLEETGYKATSYELLYTSQPAGSFIDWILYGFVAKGCQKVKDQNPDAGEKIKVREISFDEFVKTAGSKDFRDIELTLKVLRASVNKGEMDKLKKRLIG